MNWTIYHNPRCQKSRQTLEILQKKGIQPTIVEYLKTPPDAKTLRNVLQKLGLKASQIIRRKEDLAKKLKLDFEDEDAVFQAMVDHPELIERPIVVHEKSAVLGRPPENVLSLLK